jgi:hypothetical protein
MRLVQVTTMIDNLHEPLHHKLVLTWVHQKLLPLPTGSHMQEPNPGRPGSAAPPEGVPSGVVLETPAECSPGGPVSTTRPSDCNVALPALVDALPRVRRLRRLLDEITRRRR